MTQKQLPYDRAIVQQETGYWCGPASAQVVLNSRGIRVEESELAREIGTTWNGTDFIGLIERVLDRRVPDARYTSVQMPNDPPTTEQKERLWRDLVRSIDAGWGVIVNIVAPPSNYPRGVNGSYSPAYSGGTVYHYMTAMGYADDTPDGRAVWIADSGFSPFGYWISFDQLATLIPPKGYAYADVEPAPSAPPASAPAPVPTTLYGIDISNHQGNFDFAAAKREGFAFATHKVLEIDGDEYPDKFWPRARDQLREHFPGRHAGYLYVRRGNSPDVEADRLLHYLGDPSIPVVLDYEDTKGGGSVEDLQARLHALRQRGIRVIATYLPRWFWASRMGGKPLGDVPPLWNSDYVSGTGYASTLYETNPRIITKGWADFHPGAPVRILQFSETATVAGQRVDVNAFRGTPLELDALFAGVPNLQEALMSVADDELGKKFPSRSIYRDHNDPVDTLAGFVLNVDARIHEEFVEQQALLGVPEFVDKVKRVAKGGAVGDGNEAVKRRAQAVLNEIGGK